MDANDVESEPGSLLRAIKTDLIRGAGALIEIGSESN